MAFSWKARECHFTWNLEKDHRVCKYEEKILRKLQNNLAETDFLKIENLLFKACLQLWFKDSALEPLEEAKREIEKRRNEDVYKGYKSVELLNRMWIEDKSIPNSKLFQELNEELNTIQLEENDRQVVGAIKAAALMRLGPVMFDTNLKLFKAAHQAFPLNQDFLFGCALITGQIMRSMRPLNYRYNSSDQCGKRMDDEKKYWEKLIDMKPDHQGYQYANSMLGWNLSRRDGSDNEKEALRLLNKAHDEAPDLQDVCRNLIRFLNYKKDLDQSVSILESCISKQPNRTENHHQLALCYIKCAKRNKEHPDKADEWTKKAIKELDECLRLDSSHVYALLKMAEQLKHLKHLKEFKSPEYYYLKLTSKTKEYTLIQELQIRDSFASFLYTTKTSEKYGSRFKVSQEVMDISTDESFEYQNDRSGKWETLQKAANLKKNAYQALKRYYRNTNSNMQLGILFYQNFEFDEAIYKLTAVDKTNANYLAKTYLKKGQEKIVGDQTNPEEAARDFAKAREKVNLARGLGLEPQKVRKILADTALAIAHNELQVNVTDVIQLEDRCVTSYREAVRCGSLVAGLELIKLVERNSIEIISWSSFIQMLAEIEVCCLQQPQSDSDILHAESKPLMFEEGLRSKETDIEPCMLRNRTKIKADINEILSKDVFYSESRKGLYKMEKQLLKERFKAPEGSEGLQLDGREEGPLEDVTEELKAKAVDCCLKSHPLLDRIIDKFQKEELGFNAAEDNHFPLIYKDEKLTQDKVKSSLWTKLENLTPNIDMETHYPKIYEYLLKLQPKISPENDFLRNFCKVVNTKKHSNEDVLGIEPNLVELARQSIDKVEEICNVFFDTMEEIKTLKKSVEVFVSAIKSGGCEEVVDKVDNLFGRLKNNEDFVVGMNNTWKFLEMLALIRHCWEAPGADVDLTQWTELSERNSGFSKELRRSYLEVEAALLANGGNPSSREVLVACHKTCKEADELLNKSLQSEENHNTTIFPFPNDSSVKNKDSWKGDVKNRLKKDPKNGGIFPNKILLGIILEAQPCSNEDNYHFIAMRKFLANWLSGITEPDMVIIEKGTSSPVSYDVLVLTRWCVNHAEKVASKVIDIMKAQSK